MRSRNTGRSRAGWLAVLPPALLLAACAAQPTAPQTRSATPAPAAAPKFQTGRVTVYVTDQNGHALDRAWVDLLSPGPDQFFHARSMSDRFGRVSFNGVPQTVKVSVQYPGGYYERDFDVPQSTITELRMTVNIFGR